MLYLGGSPIYIEAVGIPIFSLEKEGGKDAGSGAGQGSIHMVTGHLGTVMKESVNIAFTFTRKFMATQ